MPPRQATSPPPTQEGFSGRTRRTQAETASLLPPPVALRSGAFALMGGVEDDMAGRKRWECAAREVVVSLSFPGVLSVPGERALTFGIRGVGG